MGEGLVGLCHPVGVFPLFHSISTVFSRILHFARKALFHGVLRTPACCLNKPAECQGLGALGTHLNGHLIGRATDAARTHLKLRLDIVQGLVKGPNGITTTLAGNIVERGVDDTLGGDFLP